jgi:hypothetical protein
MRFFTAFLIAIGLLVLIFVIIFKSIGSGPKQQQIDLNSYANTSAVAQLTIDGPINADQTHRQVQITVGNTNTQFQILQGYQGHVLTSKTFNNNEPAFAVFLHALNIVGFTKGNPDPKFSDERGYCAIGDRYVFELAQGNDTIERYWATSCGGQGTYQGNPQATLDLFQKQVPNYDELTGDLFL